MHEAIKNIILDYCEGINYLEFNLTDLDKMVSEIIEAKTKSIPDKLIITCSICGGEITNEELLVNDYEKPCHYLCYIEK